MKTNQTRTNGNFFSLARTALFKTILILTLFALSKHDATACSNGTDTVFVRNDTTWRHMVPSHYGFHGQVIFLEDGVTLTLDSLNLTFGLNCGIMNSSSPTVAAHLVLNGDTLCGCNGYFGSDYPWLGIVMKGVPNGPPGEYTEYLIVAYTVTGISPTQSSVIVNNSRFRDAHCGIMGINCAVVQVSYSHFLDCATGISVQDTVIDYQCLILAGICTYTGTYFASASYITNCDFTIDGPATAIYSYIKEDTCINLFRTWYIDIMGNTFQCTAAASGVGTRPVGLFAKDADFSCYSTSGIFNPAADACVEYTGSGGGKVQNHFIGLSYGVYTEADSAGYTIALDDNIFTECFTGLYILGGSQHTIHANSFTYTDDAAYWSSTVGIRNNLVDLEFADNFVFYGNKLTENRNNTAFLYINSSGSDEKNITKDSFINTYPTAYMSGDSEFGLYFHGVNTDQFVTCNYFSNHNYCIYADATAQLSDFGCNFCGSGGSAVAVGNIFSPDMPEPCPIVCSGNTNWWIYNANTSHSFGYHTYDPSSITYKHLNNTRVVETSNSLGDVVCSNILSCTKWPLEINPAVNPAIVVKVYPNPASDQVIFDFSGIVNTRGATINIYDIRGRSAGTFMGGDGTPEIDVNTSKYAEGLYIYRMILDGDMEKTGKFEVKH